MTLPLMAAIARARVFGGGHERLLRAIDRGALCSVKRAWPP
jgi:hypothetical protein